MVEQYSITDQRYVLLGTVSRPHGIKGELKIRPFTEQPGNLGQYSRLFFGVDENAPKKEYTNAQTRVSGNHVIVRLRECTTREKAESLVGQHIWLTKEDLLPLGEDEYYLHTLLGKDVHTTNGQYLGRVESLLTGSVQDILVIKREQQEYLIPVVREFVRSIEATSLILDLPEGLLEINGSSRNGL